MTDQTTPAINDQTSTVPRLPVISCDGCGACCLEQESPPGYLWILIHGRDLDGNADSEDVRRFKAMPPEALKQLNEYALLMRDIGVHPNEGVCLWFDEESRKCRHYDLRPEICRNGVKVGDEYCLAWRERYSVE